MQSPGAVPQVRHGESVLWRTKDRIAPKALSNTVTPTYSPPPKPKLCLTSTPPGCHKRAHNPSMSPQGKNPLRTRILVLEEHPLLRDGIADFLNAQPDLLVCGAAANIRGQAGCPFDETGRMPVLRPQAAKETGARPSHNASSVPPNPDHTLMIEIRQSSVHQSRIKFDHGWSKKCASPALE
jgi:hypothetical protein